MNDVNELGPGVSLGRRMQCRRGTAESEQTTLHTIMEVGEVGERIGPIAPQFSAI